MKWVHYKEQQKEFLFENANLSLNAVLAYLLDTWESFERHTLHLKHWNYL